MDRILKVTCALALLFAFCACERPEARVRSVAETFLNVYYTGDYARAADFCTPQLARTLERAGETQGELPDELEQKMKEAVSKTSFNIVSVEVDEKAGSAVVHYDVSVPGIEKPVPKKLLLKLEGRTALVNHVE